MIVTSGFLTALECTKFVFGRGLTLLLREKGEGEGKKEGKWRGREGTPSHASNLLLIIHCLLRLSRQVVFQTRWRIRSYCRNQTVYRKCWQWLPQLCSRPPTRRHARTCSTLWGPQRSSVNTWPRFSLECRKNTPCPDNEPSDELSRCVVDSLERCSQKVIKWHNAIMFSASKIIHIVSGGALNSTHSLTRHYVPTFEFVVRMLYKYSY